MTGPGGPRADTAGIARRALMDGRASLPQDPWLDVDLTADARLLD